MKSRRWKTKHNPAYTHAALKRYINGEYVKVGDMNILKTHFDAVSRIMSR